MNALTDKEILHLSNRLSDKNKIRRLGLELGLTAYEIEKHFVKHNPDTTEAAYSMLLCWISRIEDRRIARQKMREALKETHLNLYNTEVLTPSSQEERKSNSFQNIFIVAGILIFIAAFLLGRWTVVQLAGRA